MKMTKKLILAAVAVAAVIGLASCQKEVGKINWAGGATGSGDGTTTFKVKKQTNESDSTIRGFKQVGALDRAQGTCIVQQYDQTKTSSDGMVGFMTLLAKNDKVEKTAANYGTYNFLVVGVRSHNGTTQTYASYFCNIAEDDLDKSNFGAMEKVNGKNVERTRTNYDANETKPYEIVIEKFPKALAGVTFDNDGTLTVGIKFQQEDNGSVNIYWYKDLVANTQAATTSGGTELYSITAAATKIGRDSTSPSGKIAAYANIYSGKTLNARWDFYDISWKTVSTMNADEEDILEGGDILFE